MHALTLNSSKVVVQAVTNAALVQQKGPTASSKKLLHAWQALSRSGQDNNACLLKTPVFGHNDELRLQVSEQRPIAEIGAANSGCHRH